MNGMSDLELIDMYFSGSMSTVDKKTFEQRCESDSQFAEAVAFYILSRQQLKQNLREEKKKEFLVDYEKLAGREGTSGNKRNWIGYISAAAACIALVVVYFVFVQGRQPETIASNYIENNLSTLSTTMGAGEDSLQLGIAAYNNGAYREAENIFISLTNHRDLSAESTKYLGITYLKMNEYDKAIEQFDKLNKTQLFTNPAKFYLALTLMKRSGEGDVNRAKQLLHEVVDEKLPGHQEASAWVDNL